MNSTAISHKKRDDDIPDNQESAGNNRFYLDVIHGLRSVPKRLPSKYFYDATGDQLFQQIMRSPEYYLTACEMEIFTTQTDRLVEVTRQGSEPFDLIEFGPGDCTKSVHLLKGLLEANASFTYKPIDISPNIISNLETFLPRQLPGLALAGLNGDYFEMLEKLNDSPRLRRVVLCLGANIGNMQVEESFAFCRKLRSNLLPGDLVIMGFDLMKNPRIIRSAYDDKQGITRQFNLNLLTRMNRELNADFDPERFEHYCTYDPVTGSCRSFLVSLENMEVHFRGQTFTFKKDECIWMEISQKYAVEQIDEMGRQTGFKPLQHIFDSRQWFTDAIWLAE